MKSRANTNYLASLRSRIARLERDAKRTSGRDADEAGAKEVASIAAVIVSLRDVAADLNADPKERESALQCLEALAANTNTPDEVREAANAALVSVRTRRAMAAKHLGASAYPPPIKRWERSSLVFPAGGRARGDH
jgi:hypothetical protein